MRILVVSADNAKSPSVGYRLAKAFQLLHQEVSTFNYRSLHLHRTLLGRRWLSSRLIATVKKQKPDLMLVVKGESLLQGTIQAAGEFCHTACWTLDDPFGQDNSNNRIPALAEYNSFFVFDPHYVKALRAMVKNSHYLPHAADPELHHEIIPMNRRSYLYDVGFVGSHYPNREEFLTELAEPQLAVWGYRWKSVKDTALRATVHPEIYKADRSIPDLDKTCEIFNLSKINLNIHVPQSKQGLNLRAFEIPATNSFQLCDFLSEAGKLFRLRKEMAVYKDVQECRELIEYFKNNKEEREAIAVAGQKRVLKDHTFVHRARTVLEECGFRNP